MTNNMNALEIVVQGGQAYGSNPTWLSILLVNPYDNTQFRMNSGQNPDIDNLEIHERLLFENFLSVIHKNAESDENRNTAAILETQEYIFPAFGTVKIDIYDYEKADKDDLLLELRKIYHYPTQDTLSNARICAAGNEHSGKSLHLKYALTTTYRHLFNDDHSRRTSDSLDLRVFLVSNAERYFQPGPELTDEENRKRRKEHFRAIGNEEQEYSCYGLEIRDPVTGISLKADSDRGIERKFLSSDENALLEKFSRVLNNSILWNEETLENHYRETRDRWKSYTHYEDQYIIYGLGSLRIRKILCTERNSQDINHKQNRREAMFEPSFSSHKSGFLFLDKTNRYKFFRLVGTSDYEWNNMSNDNSSRR